MNDYQYQLKRLNQTICKPIKTYTVWVSACGITVTPTQKQQLTGHFSQKWGVSDASLSRFNYMYGATTHQIWLLSLHL